MTKDNCPIVGIGASAGGLDALKALFNKFPTDSGAAFIVIQHLDPAHESMTAEILARFTSMPTAQVTHGMKIEENHVYVIPPNAYMTLNGDTLMLGEPVLQHGVRMPIDAFFWSLSEEYEEKAVAIVVSGTGSDGTLGVRAIKGAGGLVMAQSPDSAQYDGMPLSAISTGMVDVVCDVEEMPAHLSKYLNYAYIEQANRTEAKSVTVDEADLLRSILAVLHTRCGYDFRAYKQATLGRRIARRMGLNHLNSMADYLTFLREHGSEADTLYKDLLISVTAFFRDTDAFEALNTNIVAKLVEDKETDAPIRIWVPGCASGEEAYSIAMLFIEALEKAHKNCPLHIFATDLDEAALSIGRNGVYPENISSNVPQERLRRFFTKEDHLYRVNERLRDVVTFAVQNVISDPPFSNLDLISCRNLLIYLEPDVQRKIFALFHFALRENGYLFLGSSETASQNEELFAPLVKHSRIYQCIAAPRHGVINFPVGTAKSRSGIFDVSPATSPTLQVRLKELLQQQLLQEYAPAAVLINNKHQVLYFNGPTNRYLEQPTGTPTQNLLNLARHELRLMLRTALKRAATDNHRVIVDGAVIKRHNRRIGVKVTIIPLMVPWQSERLLLVIFEDQQEDEVKSDTPTPLSAASNTTELQDLEYELKSTREDLQSNIEELESANEELQAANEEVMSVNEELQSTNEELETSKEELQSLNEELTTVNNQLKDKVEQLAASNDDLANFISSTNIATLFLDTELKIGRFTAATKRLFNLISSDVGRPLSDIRQNFHDRELLIDAQRVLDKLLPLEREIQTNEGEYYLRRIMPYRTSDNHIAGVVMAFIDITERKRNELEIIESETRFRALVESAPDALVITNADGAIETINAQAEQLFRYPKNELLGMAVESLLPERFRKRHVDDRRGFFSMAKVREMGAGMELFALTKDGEEFPVEVRLGPISTARGPVVVAAIRDVTARQLTDAALRIAKEQAELALNAKSRFLATASHDLRQPLQSLNLLNKALQKSVDEPGAQKMLAMQDESLRGLSQLLNSLLDITKLDSGTLSAEISDISVQAIFDQAQAEFEAHCRQEGLEFRVEATDEVAQSDPALLAQIVQNLVANAIRYTHQGFVQLRCVREKDRLRIEVSDSGIGIEPDQLPLIFDEFRQIDRDPQERHSGLGLGLSIVQRIADLLGTRVDVESEVGRGSTFSIEIPVGDAASAESCPAQIPLERAASKGATILLVDDDPGVLEATETLFSMEDGYEIYTAASPLEAYKLFDRLTPDLIVTDFHLRNKDSGVDVIRRARARAGHMVPAILLTGDTSSSVAELHIENVQIMRKPLDGDSLLGVTRHLLKGSR